MIEEMTIYRLLLLGNAHALDGFNVVLTIAFADDCLFWSLDLGAFDQNFIFGS